MKFQDPDQEKPIKALQVLSLPVGLRAAVLKGTVDRQEIPLPEFHEEGYTLSFINYKGDVRIGTGHKPGDKDQPASPGLALISAAGRTMSFRIGPSVPFAALILFIPKGWTKHFLGANIQFHKLEQQLEEGADIITCRLGRRQLSQLSSSLNAPGEKPLARLNIQNNALALLEYFLCNRHRSLLGVSPAADIENEDDLSLIREVESYISEYYCSDTFTVDSILKKTYTSYHRLNFLFKSIHGMTISEYIRNKRIERSKEMIADNVKSISQIAYEIGYSSISNYILAFKKVYQITPGKYKKQMDSLA
jgi:AraC-like DNA-binding protein